MAKGRIIVKSNKLGDPPLLDTTEASVIEFRDDNGNLLCFIPKVFSDNPNSLWGFCDINDDDFDAMCTRFGVKR